MQHSLFYCVKVRVKNGEAYFTPLPAHLPFSIGRTHLSKIGERRNVPVIWLVLNVELANKVNRRKKKWEEHIIVTPVRATMVTDATIPKDTFLYWRS